MVWFEVSGNIVPSFGMSAWARVALVARVSLRFDPGQDFGESPGHPVWTELDALRELPVTLKPPHVHIGEGDKASPLLRIDQAVG